MSHHTKPKRPDITPQDVERMRQLETEGKRRKEIALLLGCDQATVTRHLGAVRRWRERRAA